MHDLWKTARLWFAERPENAVPYFKGWFYRLLDDAPKLVLKPKQLALLCAVAVYRYKEDRITPRYDFEVLHLMARSPRRKLWEDLMRKGEPKKGHTAQSLMVSRYVSAFDNTATTHMRLKSMHHLMSAEEMLGKPLDAFDTIVEFGAGAGELAHTIFDTGWKGKYYIVDFPELHKFQKFYLDGFPVTFLENIQDLPKLKKTLFLSTWGFSETPVDFRRKVATMPFSAWFLAYQKKFEDIDNDWYFNMEFPFESNTAYRARPFTVVMSDDSYYAAFPIK